MRVNSATAFVFIIDRLFLLVFTDFSPKSTSLHTHDFGKIMENKSSSVDTGQQIRRPGTEGLEEAQAKQAGAKFEWHFGRITRLGYFEIAGGREVTIVWEEGGVSSQQGDITDEQWEIFKLAFLSTGRIAVLSDQEGERWMHDYRFLEAMR
ncbi:hypothetical protein [Chlorogloeopsis fritschii]|uniref:hypothetical protein n=1 Tax=Chlorogloeopsis fritschii TaxID=1124 RepID=UPI001F2428CD|nr:hypothetical protein [Chlorogloeopsis fritschii]